MFHNISGLLTLQTRNIQLIWVKDEEKHHFNETKLQRTACVQYARECTERHVPPQTLHQFAAAPQPVNSNMVMHFGAFRFVMMKDFVFQLYQSV